MSKISSLLATTKRRVSIRQRRKSFLMNPSPSNPKNRKLAFLPKTPKIETQVKVLTQAIILKKSKWNPTHLTWENMAKKHFSSPRKNTWNTQSESHRRKQTSTKKTLRSSFWSHSAHSSTNSWTWMKLGVRRRIWKVPLPIALSSKSSWSSSKT